VDVPVIESMITLASVMTGTDFRKTGVTLEDLGIARMDRRMLNSFLREGVFSE